jgi:hypothetical protein
MHDGIVAEDLLIDPASQSFEKMAPDAFKKERNRRSLFSSVDLQGEAGDQKPPVARPRTVPTNPTKDFGSQRQQQQHRASSPASPRRLPVPIRPGHQHTQHYEQQQQQQQQQQQKHQQQDQHYKKVKRGEVVIPLDGLHEAVSLEAVQGLPPQPKQFKPKTPQEKELFSDNVNGPQMFPRAKRVTSRRGLLDKPATEEADDRKERHRNPFSLEFPDHAVDDEVGKSKTRIRLERQRRRAQLNKEEAGDYEDEEAKEEKELEKEKKKEKEKERERKKYNIITNI